MIFFVVLVVGSFSCNTSRRSFHNYLVGVINESKVRRIPELEVIDSSILVVLDSAITYAEKCEYFDSRIADLYAFSISTKGALNSSNTYFIDSHKSIASAIGLSLRETMEFLDIEQIKYGAFYHRDYLFTVPIGIENKDLLSNYPFVKKSGCDLRVKATNLLDEQNYVSYLKVRLEKGEYLLLDNKVCGAPVVIRY